jgi:hypothetical protein
MEGDQWRFRVKVAKVAAHIFDGLGIEHWYVRTSHRPKRSSNTAKKWKKNISGG